MGFIKGLIEIWLVDRSVSSAKILFVRLLMLVVAVAVTIAIAIGLAVALVGGTLILAYELLVTQGMMPQNALMLIISVILVLFICATYLAKHQLDRIHKFDWLGENKIRETVNEKYVSLVHSFLNGFQTRNSTR